MAQLTITIPDAIAPRLRDSFCAATGYTDRVPNPAFDPQQPIGPSNEETMPNPVTKMQWVKSQVIAWMLSQVTAAELDTLDAEQRQERLDRIETIKSQIALT